MILLSCPRCARQYDVTHLAPKSLVRCACDKRFEVTWSRPFAVERLQCSNCAAPVERGDAHCRYCGSSLPERERALDTLCPSCFARIHEDSRHCRACGVEIRPQALTPIPDGKRCPRCAGELRIRVLDELAVVECAACEGMWIEAATFDALCERTRRAGPVGAPSQNGARGLHRAPDGLGYVACIVCGELMFRRQFGYGGRASGVVVDRCREHGVWLDKDELEAVVRFLGSNDFREVPRTLPEIPGLEAMLEGSKRTAAKRRPRANRVDDALAFVADLFFGDLLA